MNKGHILVVLTALVSGFSIFINKFGVSYTNPYIFTFIRNGVVALMLLSGVLLLRRTQLHHIRTHWRKLVGIGLIGGSIPFMLFFRGLQLTSSAKASFIHKSMFVIVAVLAYYLLKERQDKRFIAVAGLLLAGNALLLGLSWEPLNLGDVLVAVAMLLWAAENVLSKYTLKDVPADIVGLSRMFFGSLFIFAFLLASGTAPLLLELNLIQVAWALVPATMLLAYVMLWYHGLARIKVTTATAILLLGSPITTLLNVLNGSAVSAAQILGMVLLAGGIILLLTQEMKLSWTATA